MPKQVSVCACLFSVEGPNPRKRHWLKSFHSCHSFPSNTYCTEILSFPVVPSSLLRAWTRVQGSTIRQACLELMDSTLLRALIKITTSNLRFQADHSIKSPKNHMSRPPPPLTHALTHPSPAYKPLAQFPCLVSGSWNYVGELHSCLFFFKPSYLKKLRHTHTHFLWLFYYDPPLLWTPYRL